VKSHYFEHESESVTGGRIELQFIREKVIVLYERRYSCVKRR
jgi:hypothetical protein